MNFDVIVLGSGPGGYVTAIRASQEPNNSLKNATTYCNILKNWCLNPHC